MFPQALPGVTPEYWSKPWTALGVAINKQNQNHENKQNVLFSEKKTDSSWPPVFPEKNPSLQIQQFWWLRFILYSSNIAVLGFFAVRRSWTCTFYFSRSQFPHDGVVEDELWNPFQSYQTLCLTLHEFFCYQSHLKDKCQTQLSLRKKLGTKPIKNDSSHLIKMFSKFSFLLRRIGSYISALIDRENNIKLENNRNHISYIRRRCNVISHYF